MAWQTKMKSVLKGVKENEELKKYTTVGVGGIADYFYVAKTIEGLVKAVAAARSIGAPYRVIGLGSNILISDSGYPGLVILNRTSTLNIDSTSGRVIAESGVPLSRLILEAAGESLGGLEQLYGIPGTVGGAIITNAGAHGVSISDYFKSSSVMISSEKISSCKNQWFDFGYRTSKLKYKTNNAPPVILNAIFQFQRRKKESILEDISKARKWRQMHQPLGQRTFASVFKNPAGTDAAKEECEIQKTAGYLLEQSGAKKFSVGDAKVSKLHANWIINSGKASSRDIRMLIEKMRHAVSLKFQVDLNEEVEYIGAWHGTEEQ